MFAILGKILFFHSDVYDLCHNIIARLRLINLPFDAALHGHGEVGEDGSVHMLTLFNFPACLSHLVLHFLSAHHTDKVSCDHRPSSGESYGEVGIGIEIDGCLMVAHRDHDLVTVPLPGPCHVGFAFFRRDSAKLKQAWLCTRCSVSWQMLSAQLVCCTKRLSSPVFGNCGRCWSTSSVIRWKPRY